jgi:hypothetical protein
LAQTWSALDMTQLLQGLSPQVQAEVQHYLQTGDYEVGFPGWPGQGFLEVHTKADETLRSALIEKVMTLSRSAKVEFSMGPEDLIAMTRRKVEPMVRALFPTSEQDLVLATLERSVVFLTPQNIESVLREVPWLGTAWSLANLYLGSLGAELLSAQAVPILGLSQETTCFVSIAYFDEADRCADYVVHEAAHIFHNCKRSTIGLTETRRREFLLEIDFRKRETFAYACEAYSQIVARCKTRSQRLEVLAQHAVGNFPGEEQGVDRQAYLAILTRAVEARNGWKLILEGCAPAKARRPNVSQLMAQD